AKGDVHVVEVPYREGETEEEAKENEKSVVSDLKCENLEIFSNEDKAIARNDVVIVTKTLRATGEKAIYLDKENRLIIVGHAHAYQTSRESPSEAEQVSELYANKIIYYPNEDRTIAVGEVHATVYPKGQKGAGEKEPTEMRKKKKRKSEDVDEIGSATPLVQTQVASKSVEIADETLPEGNFTPVGEDPESDQPPDE
ncbi:hypothetical protein HYY75_02150, partial [bacterium]|nr:hypothetical protein [bacterium]